MSASGSNSQRGLTLIEMMVVVAIIGVCAALTLKWYKSDEAGADARRVATMMSTAHRIAVGGGAVRGDVVEALKAGPPPDPSAEARAMLEITTDQGVNIVRVYRLVEDPLPVHTRQQQYITGVFLSDEVEVQGVATAAVLAPTGSGATTPLGTGTHNIYYYPNGTADAATVYIQNRSGLGTRYRVVGLPLAPPPQTFIDW